MTSSPLMSAPLPARKHKLRIWYYDTVAPSPLETPAQVLGKRTRGELRLASASAATGAHAPPPQASNEGNKKTDWAEDGQICSNCLCTSEHVKYWCGNLMPGIICNTCGKYFQIHRTARPVLTPTPAPAATNHPSGWNPVNAPPSHLSHHSTSTTASTPTSNNNNPSPSDEYESDPHDLLTTAEEPRLIYHLDRLLYQLSEDWDLAIVWNDLAHFLNLEFGTLAVDAGTALAERLPRDDGKQRMTTLQNARPEGIKRDPWRLRELAEELQGCQKLRERCRFFAANPGYWGPLPDGEANGPNEVGRAALYVPNQSDVLKKEAGNALGMPDYDPAPSLVHRDRERQPDIMPKEHEDDTDTGKR